MCLVKAENAPGDALQHAGKTVVWTALPLRLYLHKAGKLNQAHDLKAMKPTADAFAGSFSLSLRLTASFFRRGK